VVYGIVGMGGVFAGATQAPLTAVASVAEMSANFTLMVPILLVSAIAAAAARWISPASIYTEKLLRRGIDIEGDARQVWQIPSGGPPPTPVCDNRPDSGPDSEGGRTDSGRADVRATGDPASLPAPG
jgi:hypothetical protein